MSTRFQNIDPLTTTKSLRSVLKWVFVDKWTGKRHRPIRAEIPFCHNDGSWIRNHPETPSLTWAGHSTFLMRIGGLTWITDPIFATRMAGRRRLSPLGLTPNNIPDIDVVLISHSHYDHLNVSSLRALPGRPLYLVPKGLGRWFQKKGLTPYREMDWWETTTMQGTRVTFTPAQHWSKRTPFDTNKSLWGGYVIEGEQTVYFAGDSGYCSSFREIGTRFSIDIALMPIGAYAPEWFMKDSHVTPEQAGQAFLDVGANVFCPMHWGTFKLSDEDYDEPPRRLQAWWQVQGLPDDRLWTFAVGETRTLDGQRVVHT